MLQSGTKKIILLLLVVFSVVLLFSICFQIYNSDNQKSNEINIEIKEEETERIVPDFLVKLKKYYGDSFTILDSNSILWKDGELLILDDKLEKNPVELLENGDIQDQFIMNYPKGEMNENPLNEYNDPGRIRNDKWFRKLYGNSKEDVESQLKELHWMPEYTDIKLLVHSRYGVYENLKKISDELQLLPELMLKYVTETSGTYNWRTIKDTNRLSCHSFGIAIDINIKYSNYWKWDESYRYENRIPEEIIAVFEKYGFIWGGKWYHYDTMHFEYRPELL